MINRTIIISDSENIFKLFLSFCCLFCALSSSSQNEMETDSLYNFLMNLDEVFVTGTRVPRLLKDTPIQTRVISAKEIERSDATDIQDLLSQIMPGVEFSYAMNQQTHMNFGGFGGQSVLFLIDGERLAGETMDDVDFSRIDMNNVERIEVVRGASSALYGSSAGGGVINIITKRASKKWRADLQFRNGRHGNRRYMVCLDNKFRRFSNSLSATAYRNDSYDVKNGPEPVARVISTIYGHRMISVREKLMYTPVENLKLSGRVAFYMKELPRDIDMPERYRSYSGGLKGEWLISGDDRLEISYAFDQYDKSQYRRSSGAEYRNYSNVQNSIRAFWTHSFSSGDILSAGADYMRDWLSNSKLIDENKIQNNLDAFLQYDWRVNERWEIVGAARYDWFSEGRLSRVTPKISACYSPVRSLRLRVAYGLGFRAPTLKEKYYEFDMAGIWIVKGNPDLKPEQCNNVDLSAEYTRRNYNFTASVSYNNVRNRIATGLPHAEPSEPNQLYLDYINLDSYESVGAELSAQAAWNCGISARLSYAWTYEKNIRDKEGNTFNSQYMPPRPYSLTANINWNKFISKNYSLNLGVNGRVLSGVVNSEYKDYYDISAGVTDVRYPPYTLWKFSVTQTFFERFKISATLDNLFNYRPKYYYMNTPLTDGISFIVSVGITI